MASLVSPARGLQRGVLANAAAVIAAHNHPSGDVTPSAEDRAVTKRRLSWRLDLS
ncbi:MAG TPA: JAB domain-containing protein [Candidatus Binatia bacterium]|nr:JAB domain-containing protein [Candidatus Binatia bacterium]